MRVSNEYMGQNEYVTPSGPSAPAEVYTPEAVDPELRPGGRGRTPLKADVDGGYVAPVSSGQPSKFSSWISNLWNDITGVTTANIQAQAATDASATMAEAETAAGQTGSDAAQLAIDEQRRQFDAMKELMKPWVDQGTDAIGKLGQYETAGSDALTRQRALMGLDGPDAQAAAMQGISGGAEMAGMYTAGEDAMRQQGAATGGLRGGNFQGALAQFRPQMLSSLINQQYSKLGGLIDMGQGITMNRAALGQASSSGLAAGGMQNASSLGNLFTQQGRAIAGGQLGAGNAFANGMLGAGNANAQGSMLAWQPLRDAGQLAMAATLKGMGVF